MLSHYVDAPLPGMITQKETFGYDGSDGQRWKTVLKRNGSVAKTVIFAGDYERATRGDTVTHLYYIAGGEGLCGIYVKQTKGNTVLKNGMYYIHADHLGSLAIITDAGGNVKQKCTFDAWGSRTFITKDPTLIFDRGYTGHEHLPEFGLINMNGRMYDPLVGRFLSPDPFVADATYSQDFNRYSYARNNPLIYTDPSGEFLWTFLTSIFDFIGTAFFKGGLDPTSSTARQNAWQNYDPTASWSNTNKAWQIDMGLFRTDPNKNFLGRAWQFISRYTWELPQTLIGYTGSGVQNLFGGVRSVTHYGGATAVEMYGSDWGAVTFGSYIMGERDLQADPYNDLFQHEYGHYLQSQATGPFYLQRYGIPSAFSGGPFKGDNHKYHPAEQDANARALKYFNKHEDGFLASNGWKFRSNPIIGYDPALAFDDPQNQLALKYARLRPAWHDWILGPNYIISGPAIHTPVLNSKKRYHRKLDDMVNDGFVIPSRLYF